MRGIGPLKTLAIDERGNVLVLGGLALPILLGTVGLGIDTIQWTLTQREMQRAADSAALAGAYAKVQGADVIGNASRSLDRDGLTDLTEPNVIEVVPTAGAYSGNQNAVRVVLTTSEPMPFSSLFLDTAPLITVEATASVISNGIFCVIALENTTNVGVSLQGNGSVDMGCGIMTNSLAQNAVIASGSSSISASPVAAAGGLASSENYAEGTELIPNALHQRDPLAHLPTPEIPSCSPQLSVAPNQTRNINNSTGVSCYRGMDIRGRVNFAPGIYYIDGGNFSLGSQAVVTGEDVTFILTSHTAEANPGSIATINIHGGARLNLSASTSGTYAGVLFYQDRRAPNVDANSINGNANSQLQGTIYLPSQGTSFSGNSGMVTDCLQVIARRVTFIGNSRIDNVCPSNSGTREFRGSRVYIVG